MQMLPVRECPWQRKTLSHCKNLINRTGFRFSCKFIYYCVTPFFVLHWEAYYDNLVNQSTVSQHYLLYLVLVFFLSFFCKHV